MRGNFYGGKFLAGGFFGRISDGGGADPRLWDGKKRHRCILPDGSVCYATKSEMRAILAKLAFEMGDTERAIVPTIKRERKKERRPREIASLPEEAQFPEIKPVVKMLRLMEAPKFEIDTEAMIRAYVMGRKKRKDEEEWLMMVIH